MKKSTRRGVLNRMLVVPILAAGSSVFVHAGPDEGADSKNIVLEEVLVIGDLLGKGETQANVKIDTDIIEQMAPGTDAAKLLTRVSGVQIGSSDPLGGGGFDSTINMRGFGKDNIGFSIDGIPNGRTTLGGGSVPNRFMDTANLSGINVNQSAGVVGSPSRQALVGHINYTTRDPLKESGARLDYSSGSDQYERYFFRVDTGEFAEGTTAYFSVSQTDGDVWIGEGTGGVDRFHVDFKLVKEFENGAIVKFRNSYNDRDGNGYNIVSYKQTPCADAPNVCFFDAFAPNNPAFTLDTKSDGYTDDWTGDPSVDRLYRPTRGNAREDNLTYFDINVPISDAIYLSLKPYYHTQEGVGRFMNHESEGAVPDVLDDFADGDDNSLYFRNNSYEMDRYGFVAQFSGEHNSLLNWTAGVWYEEYNRIQTRTWHDLLNPAAGPSFDPNEVLTSEKKEWDNKVLMVYASNKSMFLDDKLTVEYGVSFMDNEVDYSAPIQDSDDGLFDIGSKFEDDGFAPKIGFLYEISDNVEIFAGYAKNLASISDGIMEDPGDDASSGDRFKVGLDLDEADVYDIGLRYTTDTFGFGLQFFQLESEESLGIDLANSLASSTVQLQREVQGVEFTLNKSFGNFEVYVSGTVQEHEYNNDGPIPFVRNGEDLVGIPSENLYVELAWSPDDKLRVALNANYTSDRAGFYADPLSSTGLLPDFTFVSGAFSAPSDVAQVTSSDETIPSYTVVGLDATYDVEINNGYLDTLSFNFNVTNLTDEEYLSGVAPELLGVDRKWAGRYFIGAPRATIFSVSATF